MWTEAFRKITEVKMEVCERMNIKLESVLTVKHVLLRGLSV